MIAGILSLFSTRYPITLIYMLQSTEYDVSDYLKWYWRTTNFSKVAKRRQLDRTNRAKLLLTILTLGILTQLTLAIVIYLFGYHARNSSQMLIGLLLFITYPVIWAHLIVLPLVLARWLIVAPKEKRLTRQSEAHFKAHQAVVIAVAGSYGKTTVKELLLTILSEGKKVAATPANKNVAVSHALFAKRLTGDEEVLVIEYGEGKPGDVERFAKTTHPNIGIITGLAPAHLDKYKTLSAAGKDIFALAEYLDGKNVYVNAQSPATKDFMNASYHAYDETGVAGWKVHDVSVGIENLSFTLAKGKRRLQLTSGLIGRHLVGPLALCAALAAEMGLTDQQIEAGVANTKPFEHRMEPRRLGGGWIIDDTYNGNIEGARAGLALLAEVEAKQKIYVTPGLVGQGKATQAVHEELGELIAKANPTTVVLMQNSVTHWIQKGLTSGGYNGDVSIQDDPLHFYKNLDQIMAAGDVVLMQNDWTDNYA